jgi:hypothetical protein
MVSRAIWKNIYTREFFKYFKLHSSFGLVQFCMIVFENSLVRRWVFWPFFPKVDKPGDIVSATKITLGNNKMSGNCWQATEYNEKFVVSSAGIRTRILAFLDRRSNHWAIEDW